MISISFRRIALAQGLLGDRAPAPPAAPAPEDVRPAEPQREPTNEPRTQG